MLYFFLVLLGAGCGLFQMFSLRQKEVTERLKSYSLPI